MLQRMSIGRPRKADVCFIGFLNNFKGHRNLCIVEVASRSNLFFFRVVACKIGDSER